MGNTFVTFLRRLANRPQPRRQGGTRAAGEVYIERLEERKLLSGLGTLKATFNLSVYDMAFDPARPICYASLLNSNQVAVINTQNLTVVKIVPVGNGPFGLALSPDSSRLYVANTHEASISVIDTSTLTAVSSLPTPVSPCYVGVGQAGRIYALANGADAGLMQIDIATKAISTFPALQGVFMEVSSDGGTAYIVDTKDSRICKVGVSTATPQLEGILPYESNGWQLALSPDGQFLSYPRAAPYSAPKIRTTDLSIVGQFKTESYPLKIAFSPDSKVVYVYHGTDIDVFDVDATTHLGAIDATGWGMAVDDSGRNLFAWDNNTVAVFDTGREINLPPVASAGGPYAIYEGQGLSFDASASSDLNNDPLTYTCDLNGDGVFGDAAGVNPTLTSQQLQSLGISSPGQVFNVSVRVSDDQGAQSDSPAVSLTVNSNWGVPLISSSAASSVAGQPVTFNVTVGHDANMPTGTVTLQEGSTVLGNAALDGNGCATFVISSLSVGQHSLTASYSGDGVYPGRTSPAFTQVVQKASPAVSLTSSLSTPRLGQPVTLTATVAAGAIVPTGTVSFMDGSSPLGSVSLDAQGRASLTTSTLAAGNHSLTAVYSGDANCQEATSAATTLIVNKLPSSTTLSVSPTSESFGQSTFITVTVTSGSGIPTGIVSILDGSSPLGSMTLDAQGQGSLTITAMSGGSHSLTAVYSGDDRFASSTSPAVQQTVQRASVSLSPAAVDVAGTRSNALIPVRDHRDLIYDPIRHQLLIPTSRGVVERYDLASQQLLSPWPVSSGALGGGDITPDVSFLYVTDLTAPRLYKLDLATGAVTTIPYEPSAYESRGFDLAIAADGRAFFDEQFNSTDSVNLRQLDLSTGAITDFPSMISPNTDIVRSADHSLLLVMETPYPSFTYDATIHGPHFRWYPTDFLSGPTGAVSRDGLLIAASVTTGIAISTRDLQSVHELPISSAAVAFDPVEDILYVVSGNTVTAYDTATWTAKYTFACGESFAWSSGTGSPRNGTTAFSDDGRYMFLATNSGVRMFNLRQAVTSFSYGQTAALSVTLTTQSSSAPQPTGTVTFTDTITGSTLGTATLTNG